ncbi:MAG: C/D box methylation guide ribonucleoprotein complex aNOP56 subunit [Candidatus Hadarchaeia archaeon]
MVISIAECPVGIFAVNESGEIIDSERFQDDLRKISGKLSLIKSGEVTEEHRKLVKRLLKNGHTKFLSESEKTAEKLNDAFKKAGFKVKTPNFGGKKVRSSIREIIQNSNLGKPSEVIREVNVLITREMLRRKASERDKLVIEAIDAIDEIDKSINTLYSRIREWYGIHFPELEKYISEPSDYFELITELGHRSEFREKNLKELGLSAEKSKEIYKSTQDSVGAEFDELDIEAIQKVIERVKSLQEARNETSQYLEGIMKQVAPNIKELVGSLIGGRLISLASGLDELAKMPSSTIQVLGAEKALFRSLNKGAKPPKHGIIFQYPEIRTAPQSKRGKIARALAGKLAIAARVDAMSGRYMGSELKEELNERIEEIKKEN